MTREQQLKAIWKKTHRDFRSVIKGTKCIMLLVQDKGTCLVPLDSLTDEQIASKLAR